MVYVAATLAFVHSFTQTNKCQEKKTEKTSEWEKRAALSKYKMNENTVYV